MADLIVRETHIPAMADEAIDKVRTLEMAMRALPQEDLHTQHIIHGGMYSRTVRCKADTAITGVLVKIPTLLTIVGDRTVFVGDDVMRLTGYNIVAASANRKQAFLFHADTYLTMAFATDAKTVAQAEDQFTSEADLLMSRMDGSQNTVIITGE